MRRAIRLAMAVIATVFGIGLIQAPTIHADTFNYPCQYPFVGTGGDVNVIVDAGGQYCDGPTEINWSHYHCQTINATVNLGAIALAPLANGASLGGFGSNGIGGKIFDCHYRCPDGAEAPFPNPPAAWIKPLVLNPRKNDCDQHMGIQGPSSTPLINELPGNIAPGEGAPPGVPVPVAPGALPPGVSNPPALPGPLPTPEPDTGPGNPVAINPAAQPVAPPGTSRELPISEEDEPGDSLLSPSPELDPLP